MQHRKLLSAIACLTLMAVCVIAWSMVPSQGTTAARSVNVDQNNILSSSQKPRVPVSDGKPETTSRNRFSAAEIDNSMRVRRELAWATVEQVWASVSVAGSKIPAWMTWYEPQDLTRLYREVLNKQSRNRRAATPAEVRDDVDAVLRENAFKDLQTSLSSVRLGTTLRQFTFPAIANLGPNRKPATGVIYYNTAYVRHLLENAERIIRCDLGGLPKLGSSRPADLFGIDRLPSQLLLSDPQNQYALCMDHEMPQDAIMLKVNWTPVIKYDSAGNGYVDQHAIDTSAKMATTLLDYPSGRWIEIPWDADARANGGIKAAGFRVTDEKGKEWEMRGMHVVKKDLRTWMWTTLFEAGGEWNWGADKPQTLTQDWAPFAHYGMCTVSNFRERDAMPWVAYEGKGEHLQSLADSIRAVAKVMKGAQWCSNAYIETNLAFGNCIGCHQGSTETVLPTTVFEAGVKPANQISDMLIPETLLRTTQMELPFNTSDFAFSFAINRTALQEAAREHASRPRP